MDLSKKLVISRPLYLRDSECGYCHGEKSLKDSTYLESWLRHGFKKNHITIGFQLTNCTVEQYENLMNKNFRRSGTFLYRADNLRNCCFYYTIRTNLNKFHINKELRHDLNKFNRQLGVIRTKNNDKFEIWDEIVKFERNDEFKFKFETGYSFIKYELFKQYQANIHNDHKNSVKSFKRFLIENPFPEGGGAIIDDWELKQYGAIQLCYYYKENLIAVDFLDILPTGVSSIYFIYDDNYKHLSLGKISILFEMLVIKRLKLDYLYLGYYIDDCTKMVYKGKFGGELLNPMTFEWESIKDIDKIHDSIEAKYGYDQLDTTIEEEIGLIDREGLKYITRFILAEEEDDDDDHIYEIPLIILNSTPIKQILKSKESLMINVLIFNELQRVAYEGLRPKFRKIVLDLLRIVGDDLREQIVLAL